MFAHFEPLSTTTSSPENRKLSPKTPTKMKEITLQKLENAEDVINTRDSASVPIYLAMRKRKNITPDTTAKGAITMRNKDD